MHSLYLLKDVCGRGIDTVVVHHAWMNVRITSIYAQVTVLGWPEQEPVLVAETVMPENDQLDTTLLFTTTEYLLVAVPERPLMVTPLMVARLVGLPV